MKFLISKEDERYFVYSLEYYCIGDGPTVGLALDCCLHSCWMVKDEEYKKISEATKMKRATEIFPENYRIIELDIDLDDHEDCPYCLMQLGVNARLK